MENNEILISILVPVYNVEKYIARCAHSLFGQTYKNLEFIFVDDCTQDNSICVLKKVLNEYPNRTGQVKIITHLENQGSSGVRNTCVKYSTGEYLMWVDSDDYVELDTIDLMVKEAKKNDSDIVSCGFKTHYKKYTENHIPPLWKSKEIMLSQILERKVPVCIWGRLIKTALYKNNNVVCINGINMGEDLLIISKLCLYANRVSTCNKILFQYDRTKLDSYSNNVTDKSINDELFCIQYLYNFFKKNDQNYLDSVKIGEINVLIRIIKETIKINKLQEHCKDAISKINTYDKKYTKYIPIFDKIFFFISNIYILSFYVTFAKFIKHSFLRIKN